MENLINEELTRVRLKPLPNGNFVLDAYNNLGYHIEKELRFPEVKSCLLTQEFLNIRFKNDKVYKIWLCDLDFSKPWVPLYVRGGVLKAGYLHILYALASEVSYNLCGFSTEINRNYLRNTKEFADFWKNQDMEKMLEALMKTAKGGVKNAGSN